MKTVLGGLYCLNNKVWQCQSYEKQLSFVSFLRPMEVTQCRNPSYEFLILLATGYHRQTLLSLLAIQATRPLNDDLMIWILMAWSIWLVSTADTLATSRSRHSRHSRHSLPILPCHLGGPGSPGSPLSPGSPGGPGSPPPPKESHCWKVSWPTLLYFPSIWGGGRGYWSH